MRQVRNPNFPTSVYTTPARAWRGPRSPRGAPSGVAGALGLVSGSQVHPRCLQTLLLPNPPGTSTRAPAAGQVSARHLETRRAVLPHTGPLRMPNLDQSPGAVLPAPGRPFPSAGCAFQSLTGDPQDGGRRQSPSLGWWPQAARGGAGAPSLHRSVRTDFTFVPVERTLRGKLGFCVCKP